MYIVTIKIHHGMKGNLKLGSIKHEFREQLLKYPFLL